MINTLRTPTHDIDSYQNMSKSPTWHIDKNFLNISILDVVRKGKFFLLNWWDLSVKETAEDLVSVDQDQSLSKFHDYS